MTTKKLTKLLALYLPYILLGLVATNFYSAGLCKPSAQSASAGFAYWLFLRRRVTARRIFAEQKCKEVPSWNGVRLCTMGHRQGY